MKTCYKIGRRVRKTFARGISRLFNSILRWVCSGRRGFYILKGNKDNIWKIRNVQKFSKCRALTLYISNNLNVYIGRNLYSYSMRNLLPLVSCLWVIFQKLDLKQLRMHQNITKKKKMYVGKALGLGK